ncbi:MAG: hypothetical protein KKB21_00820 [Nanoarchaeota archaeon]|nr:hypothetical protein [Nanoarchaeota archaeon]MBU4086098.1 hypothetical protein [Nanoarchaeota archaeon]
MAEKRYGRDIKTGQKKETVGFLSALLFIPGFFLIGLALGVLFNHVLVATLFGVGVGFVLAAVFKSLKK